MMKMLFLSIKARNMMVSKIISFIDTRAIGFYKKLGFTMVKDDIVKYSYRNKMDFYSNCKMMQRILDENVDIYDQEL